MPSSRAVTDSSEFFTTLATQMSRASAPTQPIRAARKTEWLRCALAHHFSREPGVDNEIVVLATGIDQYVQEVFHHLAYNSSSDLVSEQDFRLLCSVLGVSAEKTEEEEDSARDDRDVCTALPPALSFREFHSRLCGFFTVRARDSPTSVRLPVTAETEHVEREIRLRCPRVRRRKCVSFDLSRETSSAHKTSRDRTENATETGKKDAGRFIQCPEFIFYFIVFGLLWCLYDASLLPVVQST